MAIKPSIIDAPNVKTQPPIKGRIEFRNLTFAYHTHGNAILKDIDLIIDAGQTIAFFGRTGSGKSPLTNLIPRLIEAPPDSLFIDDVPIDEYPLAQLRAAIGYVP